MSLVPSMGEPKTGVEGSQPSQLDCRSIDSGSITSQALRGTGFWYVEKVPFQMNVPDNRYPMSVDSFKSITLDDTRLPIPPLFKPHSALLYLKSNIKE